MVVVLPTPFTPTIKMTKGFLPSTRSGSWQGFSNASSSSRNAACNASGRILTYPFRMLYRLITVGNPYKKAIVKKVVILGLDGMDPGLATKFMREGRMPNFQKLADRGVFRKLDTSNPSMSPVAWSTFATGVDASRHNIYDFLTRDPCTYGPLLSSTELTEARKVVNI